MRVGVWQAPALAPGRLFAAWLEASCDSPEPRTRESKGFPGAFLSLGT